LESISDKLNPFFPYSDIRFFPSLRNCTNNTMIFYTYHIFALKLWQSCLFSATISLIKKDTKFYKLYLVSIKESHVRSQNKWTRELGVQIDDLGYIYVSPFMATRNTKPILKLSQMGWLKMLTILFFFYLLVATVLTK
jgi:hypothetical protein